MSLDKKKLILIISTLQCVNSTENLAYFLLEFKKKLNITVLFL